MTRRNNPTQGLGATLADIAARCGVSKQAVSFAFQGNTAKVSAETYQRIMAVAKELGYDPSRNHAARKLALRKQGIQIRNHAVGVALPHSYEGATYYSRLLEGMLYEFVDRDYSVHVSIIAGWNPRLLPIFGRGEVDGMISTISKHDSGTWLEMLRNEVGFGDRPVVHLVYPMPGCSSVHADNFQAGRQAAEHLLDLGHRWLVHQFRIAPDTDTARIEGIRSAYRDRGLDPDKYLICQPLPSVDTTIPQLGPPLIDLLRSRPEITGIIAGNDYSAVRVWRVVAEAGFGIPEHMSLISFDDTDAVTGLDAVNALTSVRLPLREIGAEGAKLIVSLIEGDLQGHHEIVLPTELIVRRSTARPHVRR